MPELPDVEGFRRVLARHAVGAPVRAVAVLDNQVLRGFGPERLREVLRGRRFGEPWRHGKWLVVPIIPPGAEQSSLLLHFGMTGELVWADDDGGRHRHDRVVFVLPEGELRYRDMRKLTGVRLAGNAAECRSLLADLGPDALGLTRGELARVLAGRRGRIKPTLADQAVVAGLGNLLVDEILWRARIAPQRSVADLEPGDVTRLHRQLGTVLRRSIEAARVPPRPSWLTGRRDEPSGSCPRCGTTLSHGRVGGRGTVWCPRCQHR
ncbi:formamidopyrimidine-DNA glycosylase [Prauserella shujinwangii]|uniref:Formamidopyrimidine-DNA glycosylase n=1 Tax=Prauserella shujinwangii TaxID=1453103 RepID=A0A2T0LS59_9PSEU|nr:DNA-formamidopyrimidine glycosylase family protein [Prauserella shujinwangii]PRX46507.1 formamidopyrimidine-DNA glycosylase [Prauserella shujinwangii]